MQSILRPPEATLTGSKTTIPLSAYATQILGLQTLFADCRE